MEVLRSWLQAEKEQKRWSEVLAVYDQLESTDPKSIQTIFDYQARAKPQNLQNSHRRPLHFIRKPMNWLN